MRVRFVFLFFVFGGGGISERRSLGIVYLFGNLHIHLIVLSKDMLNCEILMYISSETYKIINNDNVMNHSLLISNS